MTRHRVAVFALLLAAAACGVPGRGGGSGEDGAGEAGSPGPELVVAGCYRFSEAPANQVLGLPWGIVLEREPLAEGWPLVERFPGVRRARTLSSPTRRTDHPFAYWRPLAGDSLEVGHPGGGGLALVLAPTDDGLGGRGRSTGDALRPGEAPGPRGPRPVRAERIPCPE